jgi:hypothetical protein
MPLGTSLAWPITAFLNPDPYCERCDHETFRSLCATSQNSESCRRVEYPHDGVFDRKFVLAMETMAESFKTPFINENASDLNKRWVDSYGHFSKHARLLYLLSGRTARMLRLEQHRLDWQIENRLVLYQGR